MWQTIWHRTILGYKNCICSKVLNGDKMIDNVTWNSYGGVCKFCTVYIGLLIITFIIHNNYRQ